MSLELPSSDRLLAIIKTQTEIAKAALDLSAVMNLVSERAQTMTGASAAVVELADGEDMVYRATTGTLAKFLGLRLKRVGSLSGMCVEQGVSLICQDSETDPRVDRETCRRVGVRSMVVVPLRHRETVAGVLKVLSPEPNMFDSKDIQTLELTSELIGASMAHASEFATREEETRVLFVRATQDSLTGLANRAFLYDRLRMSVVDAKRANEKIGILSIDMDGLKQINDTHGHLAGDAAIKEAAKRIRSAVRETDTAARLGGDEFAVVLARVANLEGAALSLQRVRDSIHGTFEFGGKQHSLGASLGLAVFPDDSSEIDALINAADMAMYESKRERKKGRG